VFPRKKTALDHLKKPLKYDGWWFMCETTKNATPLRKSR